MYGLGSRGATPGGKFGGAFPVGKKKEKKKVSDFYLFLIGLVNTAQRLEIMFSKQ